jgi:hypothetical protein
VFSKFTELITASGQFRMLLVFRNAVLADVLDIDLIASYAEIL